MENTYKVGPDWGCWDAWDEAGCVPGGKGRPHSWTEGMLPDTDLPS